MNTFITDHLWLLYGSYFETLSLTVGLKQVVHQALNDLSRHGMYDTWLHHQQNAEGGQNLCGGRR